MNLITVTVVSLRNNRRRLYAETNNNSILHTDYDHDKDFVEQCLDLAQQTSNKMGWGPIVGGGLQDLGTYVAAPAFEHKEENSN